MFRVWFMFYILQLSHHIDGLVQERHNSIANTLELCLSCTNPSICSVLSYHKETQIYDVLVPVPCLPLLYPVPIIIDKTVYNKIQWQFYQNWVISFLATLFKSLSINVVVFLFKGGLKWHFCAYINITHFTNNSEITSHLVPILTILTVITLTHF